MKTVVPLLALLTFTAAVPAPAPVSNPIDYRFDDVRRTVTLSNATAKSTPATKGSRAQSGDKVHTGWFSYALIASAQHRARFEIFSSSDVLLASDEPGVILSLERGKLHAIFDKITGTEPRVVKTPGALLAVRGTQYLAEVSSSGETTVDVYEGTVEVRSPLATAPMLVHAGESSTFSRRRPPSNAAPTPRDRQRPDDRNRNDGNRGPNGQQPGRGPNDPNGHNGPDDGGDLIGPGGPRGSGGPGASPGANPNDGRGQHGPGSGSPQPQPPRPPRP